MYCLAKSKIGMKRPFLALLPLVLCCGCQEVQVQQKSNLLMTTVPDLYYQETLDNLVRTSVNDSAIPFFATPTQGTMQQTRQLQVSATSGFSLISSAATPVFSLLDRFLFTSQQAGITPQVANAQTFQLAPLIDSDKLSLLSIALRLALGNPNSSVTNFDVFRLGKFFSDHPTVFSADYYKAITGAELASKATFDSGPAKGIKLKDPYPSGAPQPWIHIERNRRRCPKGACAAAECCGVWVWTGPSDQQDLGKFALALLDIASAAATSQSIQFSLKNDLVGRIDGIPFVIGNVVSAKPQGTWTPPSAVPPPAGLTLESPLVRPSGPDIDELLRERATLPTLAPTATQFPVPPPPSSP
jgi:hypothetical protein